MNKRLIGLDYLKCIATIMIIGFHCGLYENNTLVLMVVGIFFTCSGYLFKKKTNPKFLRQIMGLIGITVVYTIVYMVLNGYTHQDYGLTSMLNGMDMMLLVLFNENTVYAHLWFMGAYIYTLIIAQYGLNHLNTKIKTVIMILLWIIGIGLPWLKPDIPLYMTRNFLFLGLACFLLGQWIKENPNILKTVNSIPLLVLTIMLYGAELIFIIDGRTNISMTLVQPLLLLMIMVFSINISSALHSNRLINLYSKTALHIYLLHPLIYQLINAVMIRMVDDISYTMAFIRTGLTIVISMVVPWLMMVLPTKIKKTG